MKKIYFPFDESFICVLKNVVKKEAIEDIELISPKGWGLEGKHVNIDKNRTFVPDGLATDPEKACAEYNANIIKQGGIDLQLLGIGRNGHIGFNEPAEVFVKQTHCVSLSEKTIQANQRFFESKEQVPKQAYTMGIGTIRSARKILINY